MLIHTLHEPYRRLLTIRRARPAADLHLGVRDAVRGAVVRRAAHCARRPPFGAAKQISSRPVWPRKVKISLLSSLSESQTQAHNYHTD
eukprot:6184585-Pleurochrysis_carterae.AAC.2